jgi:RNA polymerase sigma-70 factor (ECF subfamily)
MMIASDDQRLVRASLNGDTEAFGQLVRRYQDRLYPTLLRLTGSPDDALDLLQDAFIRAFQKLDRFRGQSSFFTWVYRIAVNLALSERRHRKCQPHCSAVSNLEQFEERSGADHRDPSLPLEQFEEEQRIQRALMQLPEDGRAIVVLRDLDGLSYEEIAEALRVPIGTVRSRLHRARCELKQILERAETGPPAFAAAASPGGPVAGSRELTRLAIRSVPDPTVVRT